MLEAGGCVASGGLTEAAWPVLVLHGAEFAVVREGETVEDAVDLLTVVAGLCPLYRPKPSAVAEAQPVAPQPRRKGFQRCEAP